VLSPRECFEYTSWTWLPTPSGIMQGHYEFVTQDLEKIDISIPLFSLDSPIAMQMAN
jgi:ApaG protein